MAATPAEAAAGADVIFCCVGNDDDVRAVTLAEDGAFRSAKRGAVFIDNTAASATIARELVAEAKAQGLRLSRRAGFRRRPSTTGRACRSPALLHTFYVDVQKMGGRRWDTSSLIARLNRPP